MASAAEIPANCRRSSKEAFTYSRVHYETVSGSEYQTIKAVSHGRSEQSHSCNNCGSRVHQWRTCPLVTCYHCHTYGHIADACPKIIPEINSDSKSYFFPSSNNPGRTGPYPQPHNANSPIAKVRHSHQQSAFVAAETETETAPIITQGRKKTLNTNAPAFEIVSPVTGSQNSITEAEREGRATTTTTTTTTKIPPGPINHDSRESREGVGDETPHDHRIAETDTSTAVAQ